MLPLVGETGHSNGKGESLTRLLGSGHKGTWEDTEVRTAWQPGRFLEEVKPGLGLENKRLVPGQMSDRHKDMGGFTYIYLHTPLLILTASMRQSQSQLHRQIHKSTHPDFENRLHTDIGTQSHTQMMTQRDPSVQGHRYIHTYATTQPQSHIQLPMLNYTHRHR